MTDNARWTISHAPGGDVVHLEGRGSSTLVVAFSCFQDWDKVRDTDPNFNLAFCFLNSTIEHSAHDGIFLRDRSNTWYQAGVPDAGDSVEAVAETIRQRARGYDRVVTLGSSMGGYAALAFAPLLNATRAVAVVPQVRVGTAAAGEIGDGRFYWRYPSIDALGRPDLCRLDQWMRGYQGEAFAIYGTEDREDAANAALLDDGPVRVLRMRGLDHNGAARTSLKSGLIERLIAGGDPTPEDLSPPVLSDAA